MSRTILYIAQSLDGYIADADGGVAWLDEYNAEDLGVAQFMSRVGTIIMGATTYEHSLSFGDWMFVDQTTYVLTSRDKLRTVHPSIRFYRGDLGELVQQIKRESSKDIWLMGGGNVNSQFLERGLIDEMQVFVIPKVLGAGIPLFPSLPTNRKLNLLRTRAYSNGVVECNYGID